MSQTQLIPALFFLILLSYYIIFASVRTKIAAGLVCILNKPHILVLVQHQRAKALVRFLIIFIIPAFFTKAVHSLKSSFFIFKYHKLHGQVQKIHRIKLCLVALTCPVKIRRHGKQSFQILTRYPHRVGNFRF